MARNFKNFLDRYFLYAKDGFCHDVFHQWTGISIIAGALERKVWAVQDGKHQHFPNLFTLLLAVPGDGKSTAARRGIKILKNVTHPDVGGVRFVSSKITDAALTDAIETPKTFFVGTQGREQSAGFFFAAEASNSLREIPGGGDIFPQMTEAYDCDDAMEKSTVKYGKQIITNPCMNVLACSTFQHLKDMLTDGGIMGGFASRFCYVVGDDKLIRHVVWGEDGAVNEEEDAAAKEQAELFGLLTEDLQQIYHLTGRFTTSKEWRSAFAHWFPKNDALRYGKPTEKEQTFYSRKHVSVIKLGMIYSVAESNDLILTGKHWEKALADVEELEVKHHKVIGATHKITEADGMNAIVLDIMNGSPRKQIQRQEIHRLLVRRGLVNPDVILSEMVNGTAELIPTVVDGKPGYRLNSEAKLNVLPSDPRDMKEVSELSSARPH